jgi:dipeptidyl aminopeptidase/acylaminoacyl peptidase
MKVVPRLIVSMCLALFALVAPLAPVAQAQAPAPRPMTFLDGLNMPSLQDPQLSPDGRTVAFVMDAPDWTANRRVGHIHRIGLDGTGLVQLTRGDRGESSPRWSPDGRFLAFLTRRSGDEVTQVYLLDAAGGEARRLTTHPTAVGDITWSRTGQRLFFVADDEKSAEAKKRATLKDDVYAFEENDFQQRHLWSTDLLGTTTRLTSGAWTVSEYSLSDDESRVVMVRMPSPKLEFLDQSEVWIMNTAGGDERRLTDNRVPEGGVDLSPDGRTVLFTASANEQFDLYYNDKIFLVPAAGGAARVLLPQFAGSVERAEWSRDGSAIYFTANLGVHNEVLKVDVASRAVTTLTSGEHSLGGWSVSEAHGRHVFTRNTAQHPAEIFAAPLAGGTLTRVTSVHDEAVRRFTVARQERITWKGQDGQTVEGLLFYPIDYTPGRRYPLVVSTHGGPAASDRFGFSADFQTYAGRGYAVLKPNYRGSTGYGDAFLRDMIRGYFKQAHLDVMTGADAVIAMGVADPDKLIKMGWSAGGHMTNKIITFTPRFKAASSGAGAANWISMYAQSDHREFRTPWFGGTPWQANAPIDLYWEHSPLRYVSQVKTPTIFLVGEEDPRVPLPQSVEMFRALKSNGVPTHLYVAPREGHGWSELRHRLFKLQIELEWFERWLYDRAYTWEGAPSTVTP